MLGARDFHVWVPLWEPSVMGVIQVAESHSSDPEEHQLRLLFGDEKAFDPSKLELARRVREVGQKDLARRIGVTRSAISQYESGITKPSPRVLKEIPEELQFPLQFFRDDGTSVDLATQIFFRTNRNVKAGVRDAICGRAHLVGFILDALEAQVGLPSVDVPEFPLFSEVERSKIEEIAVEVRRHWSLPAGPILNAVESIGNHGVVVVRAVFGESHLDAYSMWLPRRPLIVLGEDKGDMARSRFDVCHELGHLVLHRGSRLSHRVREKQANQFAASFLMPEEDIHEDLPTRGGSAAVNELLSLKLLWKVSMQALAYRAQELGSLSPDQLKRFLGFMRSHNFMEKEPYRDRLGEMENPVVLVDALRHFRSEGFDLEELAQNANISLIDVVQLLSEACGIDLIEIFDTE